MFIDNRGRGEGCSRDEMQGDDVASWGISQVCIMHAYPGMMLFWISILTNFIHAWCFEWWRIEVSSGSQIVLSNGIRPSRTCGWVSWWCGQALYQTCCSCRTEWDMLHLWALNNKSFNTRPDGKPMECLEWSLLGCKSCSTTESLTSWNKISHEVFKSREIQHLIPMNDILYQHQLKVQLLLQYKALSIPFWTVPWSCWELKRDKLNLRHLLEVWMPRLSILQWLYLPTQKQHNSSFHWSHSFDLIPQ